MKATFLDYLAEVTVGDYVSLGKQTRVHTDPDDLMTWLNDNGYHLVDKHKAKAESQTERELATGARANVYIKNDNDPYVLKVARLSDPAWVDFIKMARTARNPHLPKISSLREWSTGAVHDAGRYHLSDEKYFLAMMERLHPLPLIKSFDAEHMPILMGIYRFTTSAFQRTVSNLTVTHFDERYTPTRIQAEGEEFLAGNHPFAQAFRKVGELGHSVDLHEYNVMMRLPERTLVITDPVI